MIALVLVGAVVAVLIGQNLGWRWVLAPLLGYAVFAWATTTLRAMVADGQGPGGSADPEPVGTDERTLYWCEECGTEVLLLVRGTGKPVRHCGLPMHERTEVLNN